MSVFSVSWHFVYFLFFLRSFIINGGRVSENMASSADLIVFFLLLLRLSRFVSSLWLFKDFDFHRRIEKNPNGVAHGRFNSHPLLMVYRSVIVTVTVTVTAQCFKTLP